MASKTPMQRVIQAGWDGLQGDDEAEGGGSADGYLAAAREALTVLLDIVGGHNYWTIGAAEETAKLLAQLTPKETPDGEGGTGEAADQAAGADAAGVLPRSRADATSSGPQGASSGDAPPPTHPHPQGSSLTPDAALLEITQRIEAHFTANIRKEISHYAAKLAEKVLHRAVKQALMPAAELQRLKEGKP